MKPGKLGYQVVAAILAGFILLQTIKLAEIPKLQKRVDELTVNVNAKNTALERRNELSKKLQTELHAKNAKVKALQDTLDEKQKEIDSLKKTLPVGTEINESFQVTYYNDYGYTKSGRFVTQGITIAVDTRVIPLGTWVRLDFPDGTHMVRRADDTGGAVKGHIIDVYDNEPDRVLFQRGRIHGVKVTIIQRS